MMEEVTSDDQAATPPPASPISTVAPPTNPLTPSTYVPPPQPSQMYVPPPLASQADSQSPGFSLSQDASLPQSQMYTPSQQPVLPGAQSSPAGHVPQQGTSAAVSLSLGDDTPPSSTTLEGQYQSQVGGGGSGGLIGWGSSFMKKMVEKTKSSVDSMITTLDPGMAPIIKSGGDIHVVVASDKEVKVAAIRDAFQKVFGRATVVGKPSQPNIAPQPEGYAAGSKGTQERIDNLRRNGFVDETQTVVSIENFIVELLPEKWYDIGCVLLQDPVHNITLETFTQATPVPLDLVTSAQAMTPPDYTLRWSGLAVTIGEVVERDIPGVNRGDWHVALTGVSRRDMIYSTALALAGMYQLRLPLKADTI
ncbi:protein PRRC1-like [Patiria miniata]|uniref:Non-canonical purine NTP phosphatase/PRRC1 domain-containing protein n=1 Tax=Patiria miniata TaxID=46514 RepID=A0A914B7I4_PATMI|nr:protein PRRC1-like [Patiria miniata]XP_038072141.1 protein PRRC1-like [Patiria miniata]XP_038072142.1 protein PRRC1-like [Patiria miniata]